MGLRTAKNMRKLDEYEILHVQKSGPGLRRLKNQGLEVVSLESAMPKADVAILAIPDVAIGRVSEEIVPMLPSGAMVLCLDPAAAHAQRLAIREDLSYFITHPCHPPLFNDEVTEDARKDHFGGVHAKQHIVCALFRGPEGDYQKGEKIARAMFAPVMNAYRMTVEQMAILEPALVETIGVTMLIAVRQALEKSIQMGVPEDAAREFLFGHLRIAIAQVFGFVDYPMSDGAQLAAKQAFGKIFRPDWLENVMNMERIAESVAEITRRE
ncbi:MAG: semialdehyde dehydrogenase [Saprospiraceae bacterium]|nr:semialdehyde dehydrogenase [Saprospiraceae bacterium]